jgi:hypothetical protein
MYIETSLTCRTGRKERSFAMSAQIFVIAAHAFYLVLMALVSLTGTAALLKLIADLVKPTGQPTIHPDLKVEDA